MLRELRVGNLALVDDLVLPLDSGLTMLTGETGAGKSLIAGALSLLAGGKADRGMIRQGEDFAFVEGLFDLSGGSGFREQAGSMGIRLGADGLLVLRRELKREGRGRVLINGLVSSMALLEQLGAELLAIQSQDQQRLLSQASFPCEFLDTVLDNGTEREAVAVALVEYRELQKLFEERTREEQFAREQLDMWRYQHQELTEAGLSSGEEETLAEKLALGRNARALLEGAAAARQELSEGQINANQLLGSAEGALAPVAEASPRIQGILEMIRDASASVSEAAVELERFLDGFDADPALLDEMESRKALYEDLRRKYDRTCDGLITLRDQLTERIARQEEAASDIEQLAGRVDQGRLKLTKAALELRVNRIRGAGRVAALAVETIRPLALPELDLEFAIDPDSWADSPVAVDGEPCRVTLQGADVVRMLVRTNRGEGFGEVGRIASGGEKSRIFLGLSVLMQGKDDLALQLYDEIDAGLGMDNAVPVAELLSRLAVDRQVICITHLPTVAARGDHHLKVAKSVTGDRTTLEVVRIPGEARVDEIARLLGGRHGGVKGGTDKQVAYARQLLGRG
jgi:DNA repair protein RecN (Recombination protein N)